MKDKCVCGHQKEDHIYHEGACRTGKVICPCEKYVPENKGPAMDKRSEIKELIEAIMITQKLESHSSIINLDDLADNLLRWHEKEVEKRLEPLRKAIGETKYPNKGEWNSMSDKSRKIWEAIKKTLELK